MKSQSAGPSFIHAIDGSRPLFDAACLIFRSVQTRHRLDLVDLADDRRLRTVLAAKYDIVQILAVYQHVERARGDRAAKRMLARWPNDARRRSSLLLTRIVFPRSPTV
jgi:hypothetical protein